MTTENTMEKKNTNESIKDCCKVLADLGITNIEIEYAGYGDSGCIENIVYLKGSVEYQGEIPLVNGKPMNDELDAVTSFIDGDWYNNDGGQGHIYVDTVAQSIRIEAEYNIMDVCTEEQEVKL